MDYVAGTQNELGHAMVTMIEPTHDPAELAEYNRWYEFDHSQSGVLIGPGAFAYRRWVATRALKTCAIRTRAAWPNPSTWAASSPRIGSWTVRSKSTSSGRSARCPASSPRGA
jgi:hypothetical protein